MTTQRTKEEIVAVKKIIKNLKRGFGANCEELNVDCASCKAQVMISYLEWYLDGLVWSIDNGAMDRRIRKNLNKISELIKPKTNGVKKSKTIGKF